MAEQTPSGVPIEVIGEWRTAEPGASPNGGPATPVGHSGASEGPPSGS